MELISRSVITGLIYSQERGFIHFNFEKRAKSESVDARTQPCSMTREARCTSVTKFA